MEATVVNSDKEQECQFWQLTGFLVAVKATIVNSDGWQKAYKFYY